jgi:hypothetical protein
MVGTVVWPANHIFLLVDSVTRAEGETSDNAGRLPSPLALTIQADAEILRPAIVGNKKFTRPPRDHTRKFAKHPTPWTSGGTNRTALLLLDCSPPIVVLHAPRQLSETQPIQCPCPLHLWLQRRRRSFPSRQVTCASTSSSLIRRSANLQMRTAGSGLHLLQLRWRLD